MLPLRKRWKGCYTEALAIEVDGMRMVTDAEWVVFDRMEEWEVVETAWTPGFSLIASSGQKTKQDGADGRRLQYL